MADVDLADMVCGRYGLLLWLIWLGLTLFVADTDVIITVKIIIQHFHNHQVAIFVVIISLSVLKSTVNMRMV